jgi:hypothetical protein
VTCSRTAALLLGAVLAVGCGGAEGSGGSANEAKSKRSCGDLLKPAAPDATPPADVPITGVTWFDKKRQGKTDYYFGTRPGQDVARARDEVLGPLKAAGYTVTDTDQEGNAEADALFNGTHEGTLQVTPYCEGHVQLRLKLES